MILLRHGKWWSIDHSLNIFYDYPQHVLKYFPFIPNPLKGAFKVCAFDDCAKAKSPLGDLGVI
jgi:hypothetical protein